jgi:hypothetical protein
VKPELQLCHLKNVRVNTKPEPALEDSSSITLVLVRSTTVAFTYHHHPSCLPWPMRLKGLVESHRVGKNSLRVFQVLDHFSFVVVTCNVARGAQLHT